MIFKDHAEFRFMPYGTELFLGFPYPEMTDVLKDIGLTYDWNEGEFLPEEKIKTVNSALTEAWRNVLQDLFKLELKANDKGYYFATTTQRDMRPWRLSLQYDPYEMQDTRDDAILGIALVGRYFPVFLDWKANFGDTIFLDEKILGDIERARTAIMTVLPVWKDAKICFKMKFY